MSPAPRTVISLNNSPVDRMGTDAIGGHRDLAVISQNSAEGDKRTSDRVTLDARPHGADQRLPLPSLAPIGSVAA